MTGFGGLPVYLDLAQASGLTKAFDRHLKASSPSQGWADSQVDVFGIAEFVWWRLRRRYKSSGEGRRVMPDNKEDTETWYEQEAKERKGKGVILSFSSTQR